MKLFLGKSVRFGVILVGILPKFPRIRTEYGEIQL